MSDDVTWRDHVERWRHRVDVARAWISFWHALSWRRRNGLWITYSTLESEEERIIFLQRAVAGFFDAWHAAKRREQRVYIVRDPSIMSGSATVSGTRILAVTVAWYLASGCSEDEIHDDYPTLPVGGLDAVRKWVIAHDQLEWRAYEGGFMRGLEAQVASEVRRDPNESDEEWNVRLTIIRGGHDD